METNTNNDYVKPKLITDSYYFVTYHISFRASYQKSLHLRQNENYDSKSRFTCTKTANLKTISSTGVWESDI